MWMKLALVQMCMDEDPELNLARSLGFLDAAAARGADLVVFPESQFSPYFPQFPGQAAQASRYLIGLDAPYMVAMQQRCCLHLVQATANIYLAESGCRYSATVLIGRSGEIISVARKMHITDVPQFHERDYFTPSDQGFPVCETRAGVLGSVICYDRHYPESIRSCALLGAELVLVPTANILAEDRTMFEWEMRVAAFQNTVFIAMCNRVGVEHAMTFAGESLVIGPNGDLLAKGGAGEELLLVELDFDQVAESRRRRPYLALRSSRLATLPVQPAGQR
jgi:predicted amidohydrolase